MARNILVKEDPRFGSIRIITDNGVKWFCGSDIAGVLGYQASGISVFIKKYVDTTNQMIVNNNEFLKVKRKATFINEAGLKQLVNKKHKLPESFLEWAYCDEEDNKPEESIPHEKVSVDSSDEDIISGELSVFNNPMFGSVRMLDINNEPWFVGKDIALSLGYKETAKAIRENVEEDDKGVSVLDTPGGSQKTIIINESGLYSLIMSSKLPNAKEFKRWVTSEVLPSIRKHGAFMTPDTIEKVLHNPDFIIQLATELKNEQAKNKNLTATNAALVEKSSEWDHRSVLNALMRAYAKKMPGGVFAYAWDALYKELRYNAHIDVDIRYSKRKNEKDRRIDMIKPQEMETVIKIAVAMCEKKDIDTGNVINEVNAGRFQEAV